MHSLEIRHVVYVHTFLWNKFQNGAIQKSFFLSESKLIVFTILLFCVYTHASRTLRFGMWKVDYLGRLLYDTKIYLSTLENNLKLKLQIF